MKIYKSKKIKIYLKSKLKPVIIYVPLEMIDNLIMNLYSPSKILDFWNSDEVSPIHYIFNWDVIEHIEIDYKIVEGKQ